MEENWRVIEEWLEANHDEGTDILRPPATDEDIAELEQTLGVDLPADFVEFLQVHDGQVKDSRPLLRR